MISQVFPARSRAIAALMPLSTHRSSTCGAPRGLFEHRLDRGPFKIGESTAHEFEAPGCELDHVPGGTISWQRCIATDAIALISTTVFGPQRTSRNLPPVRASRK